MNKTNGLARGMIASWIFVLLAAAVPAAVRAESTGGSTCISCHDAAAASHVKGKHAALDCAKCHSGTEAHLANPGPETRPAKPDAGACQACHIKDARRMNWAFSDHGKAGLACADCHGNHAPKTAKIDAAAKFKDPASKLCASCHKEVLARFSMPSHHPVKEGALSCVSCHDPHAGKQTTLAAKTEQCTKCHQSVRGPHTMEHPPVSEDCTICHNPHGSPNRKLLTAAQPALCLQCHSLADNRHAVGAAANGRVSGAVLRNCTACHGGIHGSAFDQHLRY